MNGQEMSRSAMLLRSATRAYECPQRYIQGPGELENIFVYAKRYGSRLLFIIDGGIFDMVAGVLKGVEDLNGCRYELTAFSGECCRENVDALAAAVREHECDVLVGVGGGKALDVAKLVADKVDMPRIIVPTSASSDAPAADWAAVYTAEGVHISGVATRRSTELVLVDSAIVAKAPARLFSAGIGDALATWYEAKACFDATAPNCLGFMSTRTAMALSRECHEILMQDGLAALAAVKAGVVTPAVENVIEANILLSGLGFINGGLAGSHGFHNGFSNIHGTKRCLHGEIVAFGLVCELVLENAPSATIEETIDFLHRADLPVTLAEIGIEGTEEELEIITEHTMNRNALIHHEPVVVTKDALKAAIVAADLAGRAYLAKI